MKRLEIVLWAILIVVCILAGIVQGFTALSLILMGALPIVHFIYAKKWYAINNNLVLTYATAYLITVIVMLTVLEANDMSNEGYRAVLLGSFIAWTIYLYVLRRKSEGALKEVYGAWMFRMYLLLMVPILFLR